MTLCSHCPNPIRCALATECPACSRRGEVERYPMPTPIDSGFVHHESGFGFLVHCGYCEPTPETACVPVSLGTPVDGGTYTTGLLRCPRCRKEQQIMVYLRPAVHSPRARFRAHSMAGAGI
jgi:flavoprotein